MKLNVIITGSTGMVGKGVLLECLERAEIQAILVINRKPLKIKHDKITEVVLADFFDLSSVEDKLINYDACFFCLGVSAFGMSEEEYIKITYDLTMNFAHTLLKLNPGMIFCYVSGQGTDETEKSKMMWARVKGKTENALLELPFKKAYMFRPGFIQPMKGIKSSTKLYNMLYAVFKPLYPVLKSIVPKQITSTVQVGQAMINSVVFGIEKIHLGNNDINQLAEKSK
jgi:uncharacterized protein YbjT (DUF2867 family)